MSDDELCRKFQQGLEDLTKKIDSIHTAIYGGPEKPIGMAAQVASNADKIEKLHLQPATESRIAGWVMKFVVFSFIAVISVVFIFLAAFGPNKIGGSVSAGGLSVSQPGITAPAPLTVTNPNAQ